MGLDLDEWPALKEWAGRMAALKEVEKAYMDMRGEGEGEGRKVGELGE